MLCHSVRSWFSPFLSFHVSPVATEKFATGAPDGVYRTSGSLPSRPTKMTLFTEDMLVASLHQNLTPLIRNLRDYFSFGGRKNAKGWSGGISCPRLRARGRSGGARQ